SDGVETDEGAGNEPPFQDRHRVSQVVEGSVVQKRVAVEVASLPYLRPGGVEAEGHDPQQRVDDPDAEILFGIAGEGKGEGAFLRGTGGRRCRRRQGRRWRLRHTAPHGSG